MQRTEKLNYKIPFFLLNIFTISNGKVHLFIFV